VVGGMGAVANDETEVVPGFCERSRDTEIVGEPVPLWFVPAQAAVARLQEDAQRLSRRASHALWVGLRPGIWVKLDKYPMTQTELVGVEPSCRERAVAAAAATAYTPPRSSPFGPNRSPAKWLFE
jgi:hypothetical protein